MGDEVGARQFTRADRKRYRAKVHRCLDAFAVMLAGSQFDVERPMTGMEVELNLVDGSGDPALRNDEVLAHIADPDFTTELGRFNLEINVPPRQIGAGGFTAYESDLRAQLNAAEDRARELGAHMVMVGILPTLRAADLTWETLSENARYTLLDEQMLLARGEDLHLAIRGVEELELYTDSIAPEAACTSLQLHLQVSPEEFAAHWNAAQCLSSVQVAVGANSPFFLGRELWRESRIAVFTQATDTRPAELAAQGVRPRVWFGERWTTNVFDLFEENLRYFPAILPIVDEEDPLAVLEAGGTPTLRELALHNGTVWRWNRPVYDVADGTPHLRVENRALPAGPTVVDMLANSALYYGAVRALAGQERPLWSQMSFATAESNFTAAAKAGIDAEVYWPGHGELPASELVLRHLLPLADQGLTEWGVPAQVRGRLLGIVEQRCATGRNGAAWQVAAVRHFETRGADRAGALSAMTRAYVEHMHTNEPVHTWSMP